MAEKIRQFELNLAPERKIWSVAELTARISGVLSTQFSNLWVEGEVSNYRPAQSGHLYFTLKDAKAQIKCVCFRSQAIRLKFRPEDGLKLIVRGSLGVYEPRGEYQIYVEHIEPSGVGGLQLAFEQLKKRLDAEGLFDEARKKPLPMLPARIGVVTSPRGAAVRDIIRILRRRFPNLHLIVYPVRVQGEGAAEEIAAALKYFDRKQSVEVILLARGGGSIEDLWAFNEESVARAISACTIPIVSGVGHETDFTIADFVADVRASTPSAAAEIVVRSRQEFQRHLLELEHKISQRTRYVLLEYRHHLKELATHIGFRRLEDLLRRHRQQTDELTSRLAAALENRIDALRHRYTIAGTRIASFDLRARIRSLGLRLVQRSTELGVRMERLLVGKIQRLETLRVQLDERSPLRVLQRGYAICTDADGNVLSAVDQVALGAEVSVQLARGRLGAEVKRRDIPKP
ncbi:MAG TPA: exodeoxyribonuclease VII large subunit [Candidatus Acidoferrales bacterium]|nr:exodeoxyribonuclease VII large subunit [Candidatus Acidoferrales bacterium]